MHCLPADQDEHRKNIGDRQVACLVYGEFLPLHVVSMQGGIRDEHKLSKGEIERERESMFVSFCVCVNLGGCPVLQFDGAHCPVKV